MPRRKAFQPGRVLYWAYGSNLSMAQMQERCPGARKMGPLVVPGGALVFRLHADVELRDGASIPGGVWEISPHHVATLDKKEGVKSGSYSKHWMRLKLDDQPPRQCLYYRMVKQDGLLRPTKRYLDTIRAGYHEFKLDTAVLDAAVAEATQAEPPPPWLAERWRNRNSPALVLPIGSAVLEIADQRFVGQLVDVEDEVATVLWAYGETTQLPVRALRLAPKKRLNGHGKLHARPKELNA